MKSIKITTLMNDQLVNYASYDNLRKIASAIDGLKNASRKVLFTVHEKNIKDKTKVLQLSNKCAEYSDYLHGSLDGVVVTLGQDFAGSNNIPLLQKFGNFGTRCIHEASAPRYIFARGSDQFFKLFKKEDDEILEQQTFEGSRIEPRFYVPTLPMLLVNGSEGVSSGFAQKILSRNPEFLKQYIVESLHGKTPSDKLLEPWVRDFNGDFVWDETRWLIRGKVTHVKSNEYVIDEIPFMYDLKGYIDVLDSLVESKKLLRYVNESDGENSLKFRIFTPRNVKPTLQDLKLIKPVTENFTAIDENLKIKEFKSAKEIIDYYIKVKLKYLEKRKNHIIESLNKNLKVLENKSRFLDMVIKKEIIIEKRSKSDLEKDLKKLKFDEYENGYSYIIGMPIYSLTTDKKKELDSSIEKLKKEITKISKTTIEKIWEGEL